MNHLLGKIGKIKWLSRWAGSYTFISCSYWGPQYYHSLKKFLGINFNRALFIHKKGVASFYVPEDEFVKLGKTLARKSEKNIKYAKKFSYQLKLNTDLLDAEMRKLHGKIPSWKEYQKFVRYFHRHLAFHVFVKKTVDFLTPKGSKKLLPVFNDARLYSEKIYSDSERFFRHQAKIIASKEKYNWQYLTCLSEREFEIYLKQGRLPKEGGLKKRYLASVLYFEKGRQAIILGSSVKKAEKLLLNQSKKNKKEISGTSAFPGTVKGRARIILDPFKKKSFEKGDILITGMTRPEFLPYVKKAGAIVTDVGGVLSHAAIMAREMKIPCVVGTAVATKVFKDNQGITVDATNGTIKLQ